MNLNWQHFLSKHHAQFNSETDISFPSATVDSSKVLYPIAHLGILSISGTDAAKLLQGQITCNAHCHKVVNGGLKLHEQIHNTTTHHLSESAR